MELKHVIPNMKQTFGQLEFAGEGTIEQRRINGKMTIISRSYNLYSTIQRADDIVVILPAEAGEKYFEVEDKVKLVNPRITSEEKNLHKILYRAVIFHRNNFNNLQIPYFSNTLSNTQCY